MVSNMTKQNSSIDNLVEEKENSTNELKKLEESLKNQFSEVSDNLNEHDSEINLLKVELNKFKEIATKTNEYLLLELESNLDKFKEMQIESEDKYNELLINLKNENTANLLSLSEENEELLKISENKELDSGLRDCIVEKDDLISRCGRIEEAVGFGNDKEKSN